MSNRTATILPPYVSSFTVIASFVLLTLLGVTVAPQLTFRLYPSQLGKQIYVSFNYYGANAEAVEMEATAPLEGILTSIHGVQNVESVSGDGWGRITLTLAGDAKPHKVRFAILSSLRDVYAKLPPGVTYPIVNAHSTAQEKMVQLLVYTVSGNLDPPAIKSVVSQSVVPAVSMIEGVEQVDVHGANANDWYIEYIPHRLEQMGLLPTDIVGAITRHSYFKGVGMQVAHQGVTVPVALAGPGLSPDTWNSIEIGVVSGRIITLEQVATVSLKERDVNSVFRINGQSAIHLVIQATADANQIEVANAVYQGLEGVTSSLPVGFQLIKSYDATTQLRADLQRNVIRTIFSLVVLLLFVLVASRSFRYLMVISISLTVNLTIAFLIYYALGIEIHLYSLSGITLSLGLIIDNTLVMVDYLRHRRSMRVFTALLAATITTIGALVSIFFLDEALRRNLTDFALVIIINLSVSLFVALLLIPSLMEQVNLTSQTRRNSIGSLRLKARISGYYGGFTSFLFRFRRIVIVIGVLTVGIPMFLLPDSVNGDSWPAKLYNYTLGTDFYQRTVRPVSDVVLGGTMRLFVSSAWQNSSWDIPERTCLKINYSLPAGGTVGQADYLARLFESALLNHSEVEQVITRVTGKMGRMEVFFDPRYENGLFPVRLKGKMERLTITQAAADFNIFGVGLGFSNSSEQRFVSSVVNMKGYSQQQLMGHARRFADTLRTVPRIEKIWIKGGYGLSFNDDYRKFLSLNDELLLSADILPIRYAATLQRNSPTSDLVRWLPVGNSQMMVRVRPQGELTSDFMLNYSPVKVGKTETRNSAVGMINNLMVGEEIYKENQEYLISVAFTFVGPSKLETKVLTQQVDKLNSELPVGFKATVQNLWGRYGMSKSQNYMLIVMILIIFISSSVLFESIRQPLAIIAIIPLSMVGVFLTYWLFDLSFDQGTFASFLLLGGLVVNSAIYIINEMNNLKRRFPGIKASSCYLRSVNIKIMPVLLTVLSTVLGLLPFVVFGEEPFWFSLAAGTIGGLLFSIPAILIFLPLLPGVLKKEDKKQ